MTPLLLAVSLLGAGDGSTGRGVESRHAADINARDSVAASAVRAGEGLQARTCCLVLPLLVGANREPKPATGEAGVAPGRPVEASPQGVGVTSDVARGADGRAIHRARLRSSAETPGPVALEPVLASTAHGQRAGIESGRAASLVTPTLLYSAAALSDYASTRLALSRGATESNPLMRSHASLIGWKAAQVLALTLVDMELQKRWHRKSVKVLRVLAVTVGVGLAGWNLSVARRQK